MQVRSNHLGRWKRPWVHVGFALHCGGAHVQKHQLTIIIHLRPAKLILTHHVRDRTVDALYSPCGVWGSGRGDEWRWDERRRERESRDERPCLTEPRDQVLHLAGPRHTTSFLLKPSLLYFLPFHAIFQSVLTSSCLLPPVASVGVGEGRHMIHILCICTVYTVHITFHWAIQQLLCFSPHYSNLPR